MQVLYLGEYREYDVHQNVNWESITESLEHKKNLIGQRIGDFVIVSADYDWGLMRQVNIVKCVLCGYEQSVLDLSSWMRGKAERRTCECRRNKQETQPKMKVHYPDYVGQTIKGFKLLSYESGKGFRVECIECGKQKWVGGKYTIEGELKCNHRVNNDYSDPKWLSLKVGYLTPLERLGGKYRFKCDCGAELIRKPSEVFRDNGVRSCGEDTCEYHRKYLSEGDTRRKRGIAFEFECADELRRQGFEIELTPSTGDYGVDFFALVDGEKVAFQCKRIKVDSTVGAVQEVYAGGRYYDCCRFVVVSPSGFTHNAELMASKLGVQLEKSLQSFRLKGLNENIIETQPLESNPTRKKVWVIDGVSKLADLWCEEYGISRGTVATRMRQKGMDLKTALTTPKYGNRVMVEIGGVVKSVQEWCAEYGISQQLYNYRIKCAGLSPIEALTKKKGA